VGRAGGGRGELRRAHEGRRRRLGVGDVADLDEVAVVERLGLLALLDDPRHVQRHFRSPTLRLLEGLDPPREQLRHEPRQPPGRDPQPVLVGEVLELGLELLGRRVALGGLPLERPHDDLLEVRVVAPIALEGAVRRC